MKTESSCHKATEKLGRVGVSSSALVISSFFSEQEACVCTTSSGWLTSADFGRTIEKIITKLRDTS